MSARVPEPQGGVPAPTLVVDRGPGVHVLTIDRPDVRNAIDHATSASLAAAIDDFEADERAVVAVLTGAGGTFCAGMDIHAFRRGERASLPGRGIGGITLSRPRKPLIAAVEGWALGGGFELALACDLLVAGRSARFGLPEVHRGLVAAGGGPETLARRIPEAIAMELVLTGQPLGAERAHGLGLINEVVEDGRALAAALVLADAVAAGAPLALAASKWLVARTVGMTRESSERTEMIDRVFGSEDAQEGARAFAERRSPQWRGR